MKKVPTASGKFLAKIPTLTSVFNVFMRNWTYSFLFTGRVYITFSNSKAMSYKTYSGD